MSLGQVTQESIYNKTPLEAFDDLEEALNLVGLVQSVDRTTLTLFGKTQYGLQTVRIQAMVTSYESISKIRIIAFSDDIWGVGAKNGIQHLHEALKNIENPAYNTNKTGIETSKLLFRIILSIVTFLVIFGFWYTGLIPIWAKLIITILGVSLIFYFQISKK